VMARLVKRSDVDEDALLIGSLWVLWNIDFFQRFSLYLPIIFSVNLAGLDRFLDVFFACLYICF
jgi:hypothetical protein